MNSRAATARRCFASGLFGCQTPLSARCIALATTLARRIAGPAPPDGQFSCAAVTPKRVTGRSCSKPGPSFRGGSAYSRTAEKSPRRGLPTGSPIVPGIVSPSFGSPGSHPAQSRPHSRQRPQARAPIQMISETKPNTTKEARPRPELHGGSGSTDGRALVVATVDGGPGWVCTHRINEGRSTGAYRQRSRSYGQRSRFC